MLEYYNIQLKAICIIPTIYILNEFTEKPYSKLMRCNVVYNSITTLSHMIGNWRQNTPWYSIIWLGVGDVMTSITLFRC